MVHTSIAEAALLEEGGARVQQSHHRVHQQHTKTGYYLGTSWDHYRCHQVWVKDTRATRVGQAKQCFSNTNT